MEPFIPLGQGTRIDPGELNSYGSLTVAGPSPTSTSNSIPAEHRDVGGGVGLGVGVGLGDGVGAGLGRAVGEAVGALVGGSYTTTSSTAISSTTRSARVGSAFCTFSVTDDVKEEESIAEIWPAASSPSPATTATS